MDDLVKLNFGRGIVGVAVVNCREGLHGGFTHVVLVHDLRDPFDGGAILSAADMRRILKTVHGEQAELTADCYEPVSDRAVLLRLQNNIKLRRLKIGDIPGALRVAEGMFAFAPATAELAREIAMMHTRLENISEAIRHFELYLAAEPNDALRHKAAALLQDLKNRLN